MGKLQDADAASVPGPRGKYFFFWGYRLQESRDCSITENGCLRGAKYWMHWHFIRKLVYHPESLFLKKKSNKIKKYRF